MSRKHISLNLGKPNEISYATGFGVKVRDEYGLSMDPGEYADPKCSLCYGRGLYTISGKFFACGCHRKRYLRLRAEAQAILGQAVVSSDVKGSK